MTLSNEFVENLARNLSNEIVENLASLINVGPYQLVKPDLRAWSTVVGNFIEKFKKNNPKYDYEKAIREANQIVDDEDRQKAHKKAEEVRIKFSLKSRQLEDTDAYMMMGYLRGHGERLEVKYKGILMKDIVAEQVPLPECADRDAETYTYRHTLRQRYDTRIKVLKFFKIVETRRLNGSTAVDITEAGLQLVSDSLSEQFRGELEDLIRQKMTDSTRERLKDLIRAGITDQNERGDAG